MTTDIEATEATEDDGFITVYPPHREPVVQPHDDKGHDDDKAITLRAAIERIGRKAEVMLMGTGHHRQDVEEIRLLAQISLRCLPCDDGQAREVSK